MMYFFILVIVITNIMNNNITWLDEYKRSKKIILDGFQVHSGWKFAFRDVNLSDKFIFNFNDNSRIKYIVNTKVKYMPELSYNFLFTFRKIINWKEIIMYRDLSINFINYFYDYLNIKLLKIYQKFSEKSLNLCRESNYVLKRYNFYYPSKYEIFKKKPYLNNRFYFHICARIIQKFYRDSMIVCEVWI